MASPIRELQVHGLRCIERATLDLSGPRLSVLVGENATGKSSLVEAMEILRRSTSRSFIEELHSLHGGPASLFRAGAEKLVLMAAIDGPAWGEAETGRTGRIAYTIHLTRAGGALEIQGETIWCRNQDEAGFRAIAGRNGPLMRRFFPDGTTRAQTPIDASHPMLAALGQSDEQLVELVREAIEAIEVHVGFDVLASWAAKASGKTSLLRGSSVYRSIDAVGLLGANLANAYAALKNGSAEEWDETLSLVRLGLGDDIESVNTRPDPAGGSIAIWVKYKGVSQQVPVFALSDGTLTWLALVAVAQLVHGRSLLAFDEPELHLHPTLLLRALDLFERASAKHPVVLATHSDRLLDGLSDPAGSIIACELDDQRRTVLRRLDPVALAKWTERYRGFGDLRAAGHERSVLGPPIAPEAKLDGEP